MLFVRGIIFVSIRIFLQKKPDNKKQNLLEEGSFSAEKERFGEKEYDTEKEENLNFIVQKSPFHNELKMKIHDFKKRS